jgi:hypothetical protein
MSGGYSPKVANPYMSNNIPQMRSQAFQKPFFFGSSQVPVNLGLSKQLFSGSGFTGDAPPKKYPISRDGKPIYHVLKYPSKMSSTGNGITMPSKR